MKRISPPTAVHARPVETPVSLVRSATSQRSSVLFWDLHRRVAAALVAAERARARRTYLVTVGLGNFIDSLLLESIASTPRRCSAADSVKRLLS